jgi:hypothetical protein
MPRRISDREVQYMEGLGGTNLMDWYSKGFEDGFAAGQRGQKAVGRLARGLARTKPKRKLSAWNKFVKANSRKKEFRYRDGKLNLKKMGVAFRRKKRR